MKNRLIFVFSILLSQIAEAQQFEEIFSGKNIGIKDVASNQIILKPEFTNIEISNEHSLFFLLDGKKRGVADFSGKILVEPGKTNFIYVCTLDKKYFLLEFPKNFQLFNSETGKTILLNEFSEVLKLNENMCDLERTDFVRFIENKKMGLLRFPDEIVIPAQFDYVYQMPEFQSKILVENNKKYSFFDIENRQFGEEFEIMSMFENLRLDNDACYMNANDFLPVKIGEKYFILKPDGKKIELAHFDQIHYDLYNAEISDALPCKTGDKFGFLTPNFETVLPPVYDDAFWFTTGTAVVKFEGKYGSIDNSGKMQIPFIYDNLIFDSKEYNYTASINKHQITIDEFGDNPDLQPVYREKKFYLGTKGQQQAFDFAGFPFLGIVPVNCGGTYNPEHENCSGGLWGASALTGDIIIPCRFDTLKLWHEQYYIVRENGKFGLFDLRGKQICETVYETIDSFVEGKAVVQKNGKFGYIDANGKELIPPKFDKAANFSGGKAEVEIDGKKQTIDEKGNVLD